MQKIKIIFFLVLGFSVYSQQVQWANKVIKFSTDLGGKQNGVKRILGKPDAFPQAGISPNAWMTKNSLDGREVVELGFEKPQTVKQVAIFENVNSGCVMKIAVDNGSGKYETVWTRKMDYKTPYYKSTLSTDRSYYFGRKRRKVQEVPEVFNPGIEHAILDNAVTGVVAVKIIFNFALFPGQKQIDAVGISDSEIPIEAKINSNNFFESLPQYTTISLGDLNPTSPLISFDGEKLFFSVEKEVLEDIYSTKKTGINAWSQPTLESKLLNKNEVYNHLSASYSNFYLKGGAPYSKGTNETGFEILDANFQLLEKIKITAYNNYDDNASATITEDQKTLILGIETDMTQGGQDLYFSNKKPDGTYGLLQNLGKTVNSAGDDSLPQLLSDQKTLLFSSNGYSGFGDFDLFVTYRLDDTWKNWSEPINLGNKINNQNYDGSYCYDEKSETLYFIKYFDGKSNLCTIKIPKKELMKN